MTPENLYSGFLDVYYKGALTGFLFGLAAGIEFALCLTLILNAWVCFRKKGK